MVTPIITHSYSEDLSDNIRAVFKRKMLEGQFIGSFAPYGYIKDPNDRHKLIVDKEAAAIVKRIYGLYLQGYGYLSIAEKLTSENILTPTEYKLRQGLLFRNPNTGDLSNAWSVNTVKRILRNKSYIGHLAQGKEQKLSYKSSKIVQVPSERWITVENNHEPIIEQQCFYTVQNLISSKRRPCRSRTSNSFFSGKLKCKDCGSNMQKATPTRDKTSFYMRCSKAAKTKSKACSPHSIRLDVITETVNRSISNFVMCHKGCGKDDKIVLTHEIVNTFIEFIQIGNEEIIIYWSF